MNNHVPTIVLSLNTVESPQSQTYQYLRALTTVLDIAHSHPDRNLEAQDNSCLLSLIEQLGFAMVDEVHSANTFDKRKDE